MKISIILCIIVAAVQAVPAVQWSKVQHQKIHLTRREPLTKETKNRIVGGTLAKAGDLPFQVGMYMDGSFFCGGSLIAPDVVLTAAHCTAHVRAFEVYLGSLRVNDATEEGRVLVTTSNSVTHEDYNSGRVINDIALVKFDSPVVLNERIDVIRLPTMGSGDFSGETATVSGWGQETDESPSIAEDLQYTQVNVMSNTACIDYWGAIPDTQLCVDTNNGLNTPCFGDSGGPLTVTESDGVRTEIGVVSYVSGSGCESGVPSVFTRVSLYTEWISANGGPEQRP